MSVSSSIRLRPSSSASVNLPPRSSVVRQSSNGYTSSSQNYDKPYYQPLQRSDSRSSLINGARDTPNLPSSASNDRLSRFNSVTSSPRYSRGSLKDLSVNFDLSNVTKRDPSPAVLVSRVAIEREIPIRIEREDVEKRWVDELTAIFQQFKQRTWKLSAFVGLLSVFVGGTRKNHGWVSVCVHRAA